MSVPVIALTGPLGAGKTTVLNHLLAAPGARVGVVINDFGAIDVDSGLVVGQVDEAASIAGGCVCCLPDAGGLDGALEKLSDPRLRLDAIVVEASGVAEPVALARLIRFSGAERARLGGVIDVVDAVEHERSVAEGLVAPARYGAATLAVVNKVDLIAEDARDARIAELAGLVRDRNPSVEVVPAARGAIDPALVFDVSGAEDPIDQLPLSQLLREEHAGHADHAHAASASAPAPEPVDAGALLDLLEDPPAHAYRIKGTVPVRTAKGSRAYTVHRVGRSIHVETAPTDRPADGLVAIGVDLDVVGAGERLERALRPASEPAGQGLRRLQRYRRLSA